MRRAHPDTQAPAPRAARLSACAAAVLISMLPALCARAETRRGATVAEYRERVAEARLILEDAAASAAEADFEAEAEALAEARGLLPKAERVEPPGFRAEVDHGWLHAALEEYERTAEGRTDEERAALLEDLAGRLAAVEARLAEAEAPGPARDKEAEKGRLNTILRRPEYARPEQRQGSALQRQIEEFFKWLRDLMPEFRPLEPGTRGGLSRAAQFFIFGLSGLLLAYVFWRYWGRRDRGPKSLSLGGARVVLGERLEADQTAADLLAEAERLAREGQLRAAIRKAYVALLCELGDRKVIGLAQHKTNRDYLQAVRQRAPRLYPEMLPLTFDFELHWYGAQEASESDWASFRARCREALRAI